MRCVYVQDVQGALVYVAILEYMSALMWMRVQFVKCHLTSILVLSGLVQVSCVSCVSMESAVEATRGYLGNSVGCEV